MSRPAGEAPRRGDVSLRELVKRYGRLAAVRDVSLEIASGEFFTLLGPSGSGKTTTLMIVAGFVIPDAGQVVIEGRPVERVPPDRRNIGVVFQHYALFPHMTVYQNLAFPLEMRGLGAAEIARRVRRMLEVVQLPDSEWKYPSQLSGGQQQRVAVARALVFEPAVLLMDEPLGALDKNLRAHLQVELKQLQRRLGVTVIYVTHDQEEALTMSDRIAVMNAGGVEQVGTPRQLYEEPATRFVAEFIGDSNRLAGTVERALPEATEVRLPTGFVLRCRRSELPPGTACMVSIRPERLGLRRKAGPAGGTCARVVERVYAGDVVRYWVETPALGRLVVKVQNDGRGDLVEPGEAVSLSWAADDWRALGG